MLIVYTKTAPSDSDQVALKLTSLPDDIQQARHCNNSHLHYTALQPDIPAVYTSGYLISGM